MLNIVLEQFYCIAATGPCCFDKINDTRSTFNTTERYNRNVIYSKFTIAFITIDADNNTSGHVASDGGALHRP